MIVTHTQNANGQRRVYLGGKSSIEAYIAPKADNRGWTFHIDNAVAGVQLTAAEQRQWAVHTLLQLAMELDVPPGELAGVPFESIAALHDSDPFSGRRMASGKRKAAEHAFMASAPEISRPRSDFRSNGYREYQRRCG